MIGTVVLLKFRCAMTITLQSLEPVEENVNEVYIRFCRDQWQGSDDRFFG